jgi:hypothetical protein
MSHAGPDLAASRAGPAGAGDLASRIQRLEDERDIARLIDLHAMLSDAGPAEGFAELYAEDCTVDLGELLVPGAPTVISGRAQLMERVYLEAGHRAAEGRTQHLQGGPKIIRIAGDEAFGVTYAMTSLLQPGGTAKIIVSGFNFWTLARLDGRWRITRRVARRVGDRDVLDLFKPVSEQALAELDVGT